MIYSLTGVVAQKSVDEVIMLVGGVGYRVFVPTTAHGALASVGGECTIYTFLNVKEDALDLYGFATQEEQWVFKILISVSGVGPKVALSIISVLSPDKIALAVSSGDFKAFTAAQGVGPKVAQRIVLELKGKFNAAVLEGVSIQDISNTSQQGGNVGSAISALVALGYSQSQAAVAISKIDNNQDIQSLIKQALKLIASGRI